MIIDSLKHDHKFVISHCYLFGNVLLSVVITLASFVSETAVFFTSVVTARCTLVQSAVLRSHVVCPSVTLVDCDHIGWKSWKLIAQTVSPTPSLFVAKRPSTYSQRNMGKFGETRGWGGKKWCAGAQKWQYL